MRQRIALALEGVVGAPARLRAIVAVFADYITNPPVAGGCPILNTAVEADDTELPLRARAQSAMTELQKLIGVTVKQGVVAGELRPEADPRRIAAIFTALLEGAIMLGRLYQDPAPMLYAVEHLTAQLDQLTLAAPAEAA
jgi:TetR/AcrR family transcriptional regulator, transcriptional repressor for nem operon